MKISCLLTSYNRPQFLARAIDSVLNQTYQDFELIILEDNSEDPGVLEVLTRYWHQPQVLILKSNTQAPDRLKSARYATMINQGLQLCSGEYITYLCDDDYYLPERFELMANYLDTHPQVSVVYGSQRTEAGSAEFQPLAQRLDRQAREVLSNASFKVDHGSVMHRKSVLETTGLWDDSPEHYQHADAIFWGKLTAAGFFFYPIQQVTDVHVFHQGTISDGNILAKL